MRTRKIPRSPTQPAAYEAFVLANDLAEPLQRLAALPDSDVAAGQIRALFAAGAVPENVAADVVEAYSSLGDGVSVAVRSSATAEDLPEASFAGQQDTYLNVRGADAVVAAVRDCWASLWTARAIAYRARQQSDASSRSTPGTTPRHPTGTVSLAVVVQQMVEAESAGVMFTANPANGRRDEAVISAAWGLGESVVGGTVNTDNVVVRTETGTVVSRQTAEKVVMTVYAADRTHEIEVPVDRRSRPVLSDTDAVALARLGSVVTDHFGNPQDIEWARAGGEFFLVQARPITALPEPEGPVPQQWPMPDEKGLYFRASIVEQLPDPLSPLFADLAADSVPRSITELTRELLGGHALQPDDVTFPTINGYAYYCYSRTSFKRLMLFTPAAVWALATSQSNVGVHRWQDYSHPRYESIIAGWTARDVETLSAAELINGVGELLDGGTEYYTAVQTIIPLAATSEVLFSSFYNGLVRRDGDPAAQTFLLGYDSSPIRAEKSLFDLATWTSSNPPLAAALQGLPAGTIVDLLESGAPPAEVDEAIWREWQDRFRAHLDRYGHTVYNLDFLNAVPADDPAPLLETLRFYLRGEGSDPYERQRRSAERREQATATVLARLDPLRRRAFTRSLRWAQRVAPVREDALADVGLAWPQLRRMLAELGRRLVSAGVVDRVEDVFWLHRSEIEERLAPERAGGPAASLADVVEERKVIWRGQRRATPPQWLPQGTWLDRMDSMMPATSTDQTGNVIKGIGASGGQVTAAARVLGGPDDFGRMQAGDVLVASITTPAWTPLFAMASGVVTDIGGPLSHSSIVAREYGIPAVLGTGVATRRIDSGQRIVVDGDAGSVTLCDESLPGSGAVAGQSGGSEKRRPRRRTVVVAGLAAGAAALLVWRLVRRRPGSTHG